MQQLHNFSLTLGWHNDTASMDYSLDICGMA